MKITQRIKSQKGFTLAETMLTVLIMLLVAAIMANGIPVARSAYEKVVLSANAQTLMSTTVSMLREELGTAWDVKNETIDGIEYITYYSADTGARTRIYLDDNVIMRQEYSPLEELSDINKYGETKALVPEKSMTKSMKVTCGDLDYENGVVTVTNLVVTSNGGGKLAEQALLKVPVFSMVNVTP